MIEILCGMPDLWHTSDLLLAARGKNSSGGVGYLAFVTLGLLAMMGSFILVWAVRYKKCGPNEVLVISGRKRMVRDLKTRTVTSVGFRIQKSGGAFVWPVLEKCKVLSLEPIEVPVSTSPKMTTDAAFASVEGTARVRIVGDEASIGKAAERLLDQSPEQVGQLVGDVLEPHVLGVINRGSFDDHRNNQDVFFNNLKEASQETLGEFGLELVSFKMLDLRRK